jgi:Gas vesicle synthesis protein GvpL/GvpF
VTEENHAIYVYGVVAGSDVVDIQSPGVGGNAAAVGWIAHEGIAALVSELPGGSLAGARDLRAHWSVLEEAVERTTVLPVRFGTVMQSGDAVREDFLAPNAERLGASLAALEGKVELSVKGFYDEERLLRHVVREAPEIAGLRRRVQGLPEAASYYDRIRLGELVAAEVDRRRLEDVALLLDRLEPFAVAAKAEPAATKNGAVNAAFLVERASIDSFSAAVRNLADDLGDRMSLRYVGPLPPYSFADDDAAVGSGSWA